MFAESCARQFGWSRSRVYLNGSALLEECFESMCTFDLWERNQKMVFTNLLGDFAKMAEVRRQDKRNRGGRDGTGYLLYASWRRTAGRGQLLDRCETASQTG